MNPENTELVPHQPGQLAEAQPPQQLNVAAVLAAAVSQGVTAENVAVVKELVALQERMEGRESERQFARAFNALQAEMPAIRAVTPVPDKMGNIKYHFAKYEDIMEQVRPLLLKHGFTVSFSMSYADDRVTQTCTLMHIGGHSRSNPFTVRIGSGPPGASAAQADGAAGTYAKRHALCNALNIIVDQDSDGVPTDAKVIGAPIAPDKVQYLKELVKETKSDEAKFLAFARVTKYEDIGEADYPRLVAALEKKR